ncbi:hypothetical protein VaNZ11_011791, partial [Volvox africanus]
LPPLFQHRLFTALEKGDAEGFEGVLKEVTSLQQRIILVNNLVHKGRSLLQNAAYAGDYDICRALLRFGALPDQDLDRIPGTAAAAAAANAEPFGGSALHHATAALVGGGAATHAGTSTSGILAVCNRHRHVKRLAATIAALLEGGADPCRENSAGLTALDLLLDLGPSGSGANGRPKKAGAATSDGGGCLCGLEAMLRRSGRRCPYRAEALQAMLSRSAVRVSARCTEAQIQVAPFRNTDWVTVWLTILPRRFGRSWAMHPPAHVASAAIGEEEPFFELLGLSCDPGNDMALPRTLLRLPLGPGCQLEGGDSSGAGGVSTVHLILTADGVSARERLARSLPAEALSCAQPWAGSEDPQTGLQVPAGAARLNGPCELPPRATTAATAEAVHFQLPPVAGPQEKASFYALFRWMCSGCGVQSKSSLEVLGGAGVLVGSAAAMLRLPPPPPQPDAPSGMPGRLLNEACLGMGSDLRLTSEADLAAVVQVQDSEALRRRLASALGVGSAASEELEIIAARGRMTSDVQQYGTVGTHVHRVPAVPVGNAEPPGDADEVFLDPGTARWAGQMEPPPHERMAVGSGMSSSRNMGRGQVSTAAAAAPFEGFDASLRKRETEVRSEPSPMQPSAAPCPPQSLSQQQREQEPPLTSAGEGAGARPGGTDNALCVVCLTASPVMGFRHGPTVHCCACYPCTQRLLGQRSEQTGPGRPSRPRASILCPLCRETVEDVLFIYTS